MFMANEPLKLVAAPIQEEAGHVAEMFMANEPLKQIGCQMPVTLREIELQRCLWRMSH